MTVGWPSLFWAVSILPWICTLTLLLLAPISHAAPLDDVARTIRSDIQKAQSALRTESERITQQNDRLAARINRESVALRTLRQRASVLRRQNDERTLSLDALEERIIAWRNQDAYRGNLLRDFAARQGVEIEPDAAPLQPLQNALQQLEQRLAPAPETTQVIAVNGEIVDVDMLRLGPLSWYTGNGEAGLLARSDNNEVRIAHVFDADQRLALEGAMAGGLGDIAFDPTIDRLLNARTSSSGWFSHLAKGGVWILPIFAFAALALFIAIAKGIQFARLPKLARLLPQASLDQPLQAANLAGPQREILRIARSAEDAQQRDDLLFGFLLEQRAKLERFLGAIAVTATVAPLLGLLGTVSGMITTFNMMTLFGAGDPAVVSGGISEALVTTELGLIVAIPALVLHALLSRWSATYTADLESSALTLSQSNAQVAP